jgi:hypothetical protein
MKTWFEFYTDFVAIAQDWQQTRCVVEYPDPAAPFGETLQWDVADLAGKARFLTKWRLPKNLDLEGLLNLIRECLTSPSSFKN